MTGADQLSFSVRGCAWVLDACGTWAFCAALAVISIRCSSNAVARAVLCATKVCDSSAIAKGDRNKEDKTKALAIPILLDIFKTFLLGKCCLVRAKIRIWGEGKKSGFMKGLLQQKQRSIVGSTHSLWRGGLPPFGGEAVVIPVCKVYQINRGCRFWGRCAAQRGGAAVRQAPSPQGRARQTGRWIPNVFIPWSLRTNTSPPCINAMALTMASPNPWF